MVSGVEMLIYQGAASFEIWTGKSAPVEVMRKAALNSFAEGVSLTGKAVAVAHGAATIVNAIALGKGAAFGVDLWTKAEVKLNR